ncbi:DUF4352 domain-containing protein [Streptococcus pneumoniae]
MEKIPKEIITEDGHIYQLKRPIYKQPLFWTTVVGGVIIVFMALFIAVAAIFGSLYQEELAESSYWNEHLFREELTYNLGEAHTDTDGLKVTLTGIRVDETRKLLDYPQGTAVVAEVTVENTGSSSALLNVYDFTLSDTDSEIYSLDTSTFDSQLLASRLPVGKKITMSLIFEGDKDRDKLYRLFYKDASWGESVGQVF